MPTRPETRLAQLVTGIAFEDLPKDVVTDVTRAFVDTVGVTLAGTETDAYETLCASTGTDVVETAGDAVFDLAGTPPEEAALVVGTASHALDYDDLSWAMYGHPSVTLVPPLLALAGHTDASGRDPIEGYVAGFEVNCAVAAPISPDHYESGWHATATFGTFGATAASAKLLGLDAETTTSALTIAASMASGLKKNFGSMTKPLHAGLCARSVTQHTQQ